MGGLTRAGATLVFVLVIAALSGGSARAYTTQGMGYNCIDSDEYLGVPVFDGPMYSYDVITNTGTSFGVAGNDVTVQNFPLPFPFVYDGIPRLSVNVCTNGWINFGPGNTAPTSPGLPNPALPNSVIAAWWTDLEVVNPANLRYELRGDGIARRFVISWIGAQQAGNPAFFVGSFQIQLYEQSGAIRIQWQSAIGTWQQAPQCAIGIENTTGTAGLQYFFNGNPASNTPFYAVGFWPVGSSPPWGLPPPGSSGWTPPGGSGTPPGGTGSPSGPGRDNRDEGCGAGASSHGAFFVLACALTLAAAFARKS